MKHTLMVNFVLFLCAMLHAARAASYIELNGFYLSDALTVGEAQSSTKLIVNGSVRFAIDKNKRYQNGWNYSSHALSDKTDVSARYGRRKWVQNCSGHSVAIENVSWDSCGFWGWSRLLN